MLSARRHLFTTCLQFGEDSQHCSLVLSPRQDCQEGFMSGHSKALFALALIFSIRVAIAQTGGESIHPSTPSPDKDVLWEFDTGG